MSEAPRDQTGAEAEKPEDPKNYGVSGYNVKVAIKSMGKPVEIEATFGNVDVLISNQGTQEGDPKIVLPGNNKKLIDDDVTIFLSAKNLKLLGIDTAKLTHYIDEKGKIARIYDDGERQKVSAKIAESVGQILAKSTPPPRRRFSY
jgi:hypothetical protein